MDIDFSLSYNELIGQSCSHSNNQMKRARRNILTTQLAATLQLTDAK